MKKKLKEIVQVLAYCPAMYTQNVERKNFKHHRMCTNSGHNICGAFYNCPMWKNRIDCWKSVLDYEERFNER